MDSLILPAVSLTDPWASLCVAGVKTLETRKGALLSRFSGVLVICRTKAPSTPYDLSPFGVTMPKKPYAEDDRGMGIGVVLVARTWRFRGGDGLFADHKPDLHCRACYHDIEGRYLSDLTRAAWFSRPVPAHGGQHRFKVEVPLSFLPDWAVPRG